MSRPKEFIPDVALEAAMEAFWERGYGATSVEELTARTGVQRASLYGTFGDKRHLFLAALARYQQEGLAQIRAVLETERPAAASLRAWFESVVGHATAEGGGKGCLCVNTTVELAPHDPEIAASMRAYGAQVEAMFEACVRRGQQEGGVRADLEPRAAARFLATTMLGLAVTARAAPSREALTDVVRIALAALEP